MLRKLTADLSTYAAGMVRTLHSFMLWMSPQLPLFLCIIIGAAFLFFIHMWIKWLRNVSYAVNRHRAAERLPQGAALPEAMRYWTAVWLSERLWSKLQRRWGAAEPAQTMREYMLTRSFSTEEQRSALFQLGQIMEAARYDNRLGGVTCGQLKKAWGELQKTSRNKA
jgi:hypothetical protein